MGFWADTFGGGNSFSESVANVFTPSDGAKYEGGNLVHDGGSNDGQAFTAGSTSHTGNVISGSANSESTGHVVSAGDTLSEIAAKTGTSVDQLMALNGITDPKQLQVGTPLKTTGAASFFKDGISIFDKEKNTVKGAAPTGMMKALGYVSPIGIVGKLAGWANGLDPEKDTTSVVDGRQVYVNSDGMNYSYNFLGLPYEVKVKDGKVFDSLSEDASGLFPGDEGYNKATSGYQKMADEQRAQGNNDEADRILAEAETNSSEPTSGGGSTGDGTGELNIANITQMAIDAGIITSNAEIEAMLADPMGYFARKGMKLSDLVSGNVVIDPNTEGTSIDPNADGLMLEGDANVNPDLVDETATIDGVNPAATETYVADTVADNIAGNSLANVDAVTGTVSNDALIDPNENQIDITGAATGVNEDGTVSVVGEALNDYASINTSMIIDTSTVSGKLLAQKLRDEGENYVDSKATILGQMKIISEEFKGPNGEPVIPPWAQGMARDIQRSMAFSGVTGTAATAAMSNAIMEATLGIAEKEANFFQTLTTKNLDNQQQSLINKMNILSKFEVANLDARQAAMVQNAKHFMEMDMANLTNEQQAEVLNTQAMVDALFNDQAALNAARLFGAEQGNDMQMFYDELVFQSQRYNSQMLNEMRRFNTGEINDAAEFNATMADSRERYNSNMQYQIDVYNADWRQKVTETNAEMLYDAYAADVKNAADLNQEGLNRIWDRVDSMLDYYFKGSQTEAELEARVLMAEIAAASSSSSGGGSSGMWSAIGSIGAAIITSSDIRLKENIEYRGVISGIPVFTWDWNDEAKRIGVHKNPTFGVIAQEVQKTHPDAVIEGKDGYLMVNYGKLR